jgi:Kef-type K+ transport system membrane component KefB
VKQNTDTVPHNVPTASDAPGTARMIAAYAAMILGAVAIFLALRYYGEGIAAPAAQTLAPRAAAAGSHVLWHLLLALAAVVSLGRLMGRLFRAIGQPPVIGEVVAGIMLGPSLLGAVFPAASSYILPADVAPYLGILAQLGVILYMFLVGLELNPESLRGQVHTTVATAHASIALPFVLGAALAVYLYPRFSTADVPFTHFALFLGVAMSITAFPVLARILVDQRMSRTRIGALALTCAAINDVTAWCLLVFVIGVVHESANGSVVAALLIGAFIAAMFLIVRPGFERLAHSSQGDQASQRAITVTLISLLLAALATEAIGVHAIFGAFLLGVVIPHESPLARTLHNGMSNLVTILFMPAFFAFTGMRIEIGLLSGGYEWLVCGLIIAIATFGKFGGTFAAGRLTGLDTRYAVGLGILMNTRGLMEVIVLNVGLDLGVISPTVFTMMILMAIATTMMTTPLLHLVFPAHPMAGVQQAHAIAREARRT